MLSCIAAKLTKIGVTETLQKCELFSPGPVIPTPIIITKKQIANVAWKLLILDDWV